ncbi:hypothetical protein JXA84_02770 [candidate division WOR-3 bacterium]|nr:hypothetical protein [candidate division WOR-3 bacterium]
MKIFVIFMFLTLLLPRPSLLSLGETGHEGFFGPSPVMPPTQVNSPGSLKGAKTVQNSMSIKLLVSVILKFDFFWDENNDGEAYIPVSTIEPNRLFQKYLKGKSPTDPL